MTANRKQSLQWLLVPFISRADSFDTKEGLKLGKRQSSFSCCCFGVKCNPQMPYVRPTGYTATPIKDQNILSLLLPLQFGWLISEDDIILFYQLSHSICYSRNQYGEPIMQNLMG